ncbi:MAG TPA: PilZ domain-containing protein [Polyangiaceae bacterium]
MPARAVAEETWAPRPPQQSGVHEIGSRAFVALRLVPDQPDTHAADRAPEVVPSRVIAVEFTEATHFFTSLAGNVEDGGIFVATYERLPVGTQLAIWFELPAGSVLDARGEVRWIRDDGSLGHPGLGIAFTELAPEAHEAILEHCARHPPLYADA